jgi:hypothetical protein
MAITIYPFATARIAWNNITGKPTSFPPSTHASSHAVAGSDFISPVSIGAADLTDARFPTLGEKGALAGTSGFPSGGNPYVTNADARNSNARTPLVHASTHQSGGSDELSLVSLNGNLVQTRSHDTPDTDTAPTALHHTLGTSGNQACAGNDARLSDARTPIAHASTHNDGGSDQLSLPNLNGNLTQARSHDSVDTDAGAASLHHTIGTTVNQAASGADSRFPTANEKSALMGTDGAPSGTNKYVTDSDPRNSNSRTPTLHASTHNNGGTDQLSLSNLNGSLTQARTHDSADTDSAPTSLHHTLGTGANQACAGNDSRLSDARTPTAHGSTHLSNGSDAIPGATITVGGLMPASDKTKLDNATSSNVGSTLVFRDAAGRFQATDPIAAQDVATKAYTDALASSIDPKDSVRVATTANITLSGTQTIDGVTVNAGDRVLVKNQTAAAENGIYVVAAGAWSRSADADLSSEVTSGMYCFVSEGTENADSGWVLTTNDPITLGTTALNFTQFTGAGQINAGTALSKTGNTLNVVLGTTAGTACSGNDARLSDARTPTAHASSHASGGTDPITPAAIGAVPATRQVNTGTGLTGGGDLSTDRTLSVVADSTNQQVRVSSGGSLIGTRREVNFIAGTNINLTIADDAANNRVNVTVQFKLE